MQGESNGIAAYFSGPGASLALDTLGSLPPLEQLLDVSGSGDLLVRARAGLQHPRLPAAAAGACPPARPPACYHACHRPSSPLPA